MERITSEDDLHRANILVAWSVVDRMTPEQFQRLCEVTVEQFQSGRERRETIHAG